MQTLILKGYGLSRLYPLPSHCPCGDIDIYLRHSSDGNWNICDFGNNLMENKGIEVDYKSKKHSKFSYNGITVETTTTSSIFRYRRLKLVQKR